MIYIRFLRSDYVRLLEDHLKESSMSKPVKSINCENCECKDRGIFCEIEGAVLSTVSAKKVMNRYKKGQTIFFEGNPPFGLYCINSGKIKVTKAGPDGKESIVRIAAAGDILGHRSLFSHENYTATATVMEDAAVCFLDKKFIYQLIEKEPSVALNVIQKLSLDMGAAEDRGAALSQKNVRERLAELLLNLNKTYGRTDENRRLLDIKLTREEMASMVGTANETIIRFISEFKEEGLITEEGKVIYILNETKLLEFANLEY